eukprot:gene30131-67275_t
MVHARESGVWGIPMMGVSAYPNEEEVLIPNFTMFGITRRDVDAPVADGKRAAHELLDLLHDELRGKVVVRLDVDGLPGAVQLGIPRKMRLEQLTRKLDRQVRRRQGVTWELHAAHPGGAATKVPWIAPLAPPTRAHPGLEKSQSVMHCPWNAGPGLQGQSTVIDHGRRRSFDGGAASPRAGPGSPGSPRSPLVASGARRRQSPEPPRRVGG